MNSANNLDKVAIIDLRGPDPGAFHDVYRTYAMRARLLRNFGTAANQVLWRGQVAAHRRHHLRRRGDPRPRPWLARVERDGRNVGLARKILENRPASVTDRCTDGAGHDIPARCATRRCRLRHAAHGRRRAARRRHAPVPAEAAGPRATTPSRSPTTQWARLQATFPGGVCDYTRPGVKQRGAIALAHLPGRRRQGRLRRPPAGPGARVGCAGLTAGAHGSITRIGLPSR